MKLPEELQFIANSMKPQKTTDARMDGRVCVITGATSGVGYAAAKRLARGGAHLVIVNRNAVKAANVQAELARDYDAHVDSVLADFTRLSDVRQAAATILERYPRIDVLINNVGVHHTRRTVTADGIETAFYVNHLASFLLTRLLLDRIKQQVHNAGPHYPGELARPSFRRPRPGRPQLGSTALQRRAGLRRVQDRADADGLGTG